MRSDHAHLALVARSPDARSQTFVRRHIEHLFDGRTVVLSNKRYDEPILGRPTLVYRRSRIEQFLRANGITLPGWASGALLGPVGGYREFLDRHKVSHILCEFGYVTAEIAPHLALTGRPVYSMFRGSDASSRLSNPTYRTLLRQVMPMLDGVISVSGHLLENLDRHGLRHPRSIVVPSGVDTGLFAPGKPEPGLCVCVGRLVPKKAPDKLLHAFAGVAGAHDLRLEFIGHGEALPEMQRLAAELGIGDRVTFTGYMPHELVVERLRSASIYVQYFETAPNGDTEGMPNVIQEAMACGLPVVTTRHAGIPDHISSGVNGLLVEEGDVKGLSGALESLAANGELRAQLGKAARHYAVESLDFRLCHARIESFIQETDRVKASESGGRSARR